MPQTLFPLLSQAAKILPLISEHLLQAAGRCSLPVGFSLDMVPILEEELFGYELTPMAAAETCLTVGCKHDGTPVLRKEILSNVPREALRLATLDGETIARGPRESPLASDRQDWRFADWASAARFACAELETLFPGTPRKQPLLNLGPNASLERALLAAATTLAQWNPIIHFCGLPHEEQLGYALYGAAGGRGELVFRRPNQWTLYWKSAHQTVREAWSVVGHDLPLTKNAPPAEDAPQVQRISAQVTYLLR